MVIGNPDVSVTAPNAATNAAGNGGVGANSLAHPSGIPQDKIDNIMSGIANTGDVKMNNHRKKLRQRFDIIKKLGQGTYGKVQLGINKETGQEVAIKTIKKCKIEAEADLVRIRREVQIMSSVQHPNIIHIYEVFENREKMVLVMEFAAGGELYDYLSERKVLNEEEARRIFRQVATAVYYCHKHKICHRDLKLENILLDEHGNAKIADFGLSNVFDDQRLLATFCGSPLYASPEIVEGTPYQGPEVDCWSLGVLLYTLVYGSMPFDGSNFKRLVKQISQGDYYEPKKPSRASSLIRDMLTVCPRKRATIEQICSHWWVNENDNVSCLDLAEDLANQTPVRLDVLLSLTPAAITADQLVVPSADGIASAKAGERVPRSHSVGSIRDIGANTEAERRILDMVAAGGEAALMPSPTRTITPAQSPVQSKRKLQTTVSMENAAGAVKKKEKPGSSGLLAGEPAMPMCEEDAMEIEAPAEQLQLATPSEAPAAKEPALKSTASPSFSKGDMKLLGDMCEQLVQGSNGIPVANSSPSDSAMSIAVGAANQPRPKAANKLDAVEEAFDEKDPTKVIKKFVSKHKTADLVNAIGQIAPNEPSSGGGAASSQPHAAAAAPPTGTSNAPPFVRKCSLQDESSLNKFGTERRKSRILETAEKFQQMNAGSTADKPKKLVIPGVSVGSYKKEFERKATATTATPGPTAGELRAMEQVAAAAAAAKECEAVSESSNVAIAAVESSDSKNSVASLTLDDARRSMENSIALLRQAQSESSTDVDQLCAQTENIGVSDNDRERKLKNARAIIGNAIQPVIRRPQPPLGIGHGDGSRPGSGGCGTGGKAVGGHQHMQAASGGGFFGSGVHTPSQSRSLPVTPLKAPALTKSANVATAAVRQFIIGRLSAAGQSPQSPAHFNQSPVPPSTMRLYDPATSQNPSQHQQQEHKYIQQNLNQHLHHQLHQQCPQLQLNQYPRQLHRTSIASANATATPTKPTATLASVTTASGIAAINSVPKPFYNASPSPSTLLKSSPGGDPSPVVKTSTASITLKSATLPRRKATAKTGIQLDIKPHIVEQPSMRFTTEMQHPVPDLRSAPPRDIPAPYSPIKAPLSGRATSLEPKEHIIPIQRPQTAYARTTSNTTTTTARSGSLSRQSTLDSESDTTTTNMSQSTITGTGSSQPIKKSPREFIIPIAVEGGGFITPREGSIEPSESSHTTSSRSTFSRLRPTRRIGSILNDSGVDEALPFQKIRTGSINKDGDDDARFTLHRLRSSRPVKKISQDNDSQSSGEEDDDDGFEILTAENLFSTLLQRVRALTNRLNVNSDLTSGFPNSSRLLSNMRQGQGPFWNQEPFGSRINSSASNVGAPWRHSLSRDLGSDMESMFSRTGATLPRGMNTSAKDNRTPTEIIDSPSANLTDEETIENIRSAAIEEPLDLADLDLSRLRLSKQDLETLSSIAPGLPKCFQEQLLAKLPPTQARKLSRTLSVQASPQKSSVKVYKRSQSGGRDSITEPSDAHRSDATANLATICDLSGRCSNSLISRRNASRSRCDYDTGTPSSTSETEAVRLKSGTNSVCREDDCGKSLCSPLVSDINERYKYYSPYLTKSGKDMTYTDSGSVSPQKRYGCVSPRESTTTALGRPPSGYLSPPPTINADCGSGSLRRRYISRFLRPDFFDNSPEESPYQREKKMRERETQSVLREIREKPRDSSRERILSNHSPPSEDFDVVKETHSQHARNKSIGCYSDCLRGDISATNTAKQHRRSLSRPPDLGEEMNKHQLADKILQELQLLSVVRSQQDKSLSVPKEEIPLKPTEVQCTATAISQAEEGSCLDSASTIKRIKKMKTKENSIESKTDVNGKIPTTVLKKVRKIVKNGETTKTQPLIEIAADAVNTDECHRVLSGSVEQKKESKLKRPKSYPMKDYVPGSVLKTETPCSVFPSKVPSKSTTISEGSPESNGFILTETKSTTAGAASRESRLIRPKSYPATKLTPPKEVKKIIRSGIATPIQTQAGATISCSVSRQSTSEEKSLSATPTGRGSFDTSSSSSESRPATIKKVVKVTKKSKLAQPMSVIALTTIADANCKEPNQQQLKDKSPEKKPHKGLLYAIGQKFEKLRDSAMNKDKKATGSNSSVKNCAPSKVTNTPNSQPLEEPKKKMTLHMKKKSSDNALMNTDKTPCATPIETSAKTPRTSRAPTKTSEMEKSVRSEKRSRIDAMIRSLRERSVPRSHATTESNYIKRAVSVEEIPGRFNRNAVTRVMGLFKRFEKDGNERRVRSTRSTSNIERHIREFSPSPIYSNITSTKCALTTGAISTITNNGHNIATNCVCHVPSSTKQNVSCPECIEIQPAPPVAKRHEEKVKVDHENCLKDSVQSNRDKRKGLMLDFNKLEKLDCNQAPINQKSKTNFNNTTYSNLHPYPGAVNNPSNNSSSQQSMDNAINNNNTSLTNNNSLSMQTSQTSGYHTSSAHEINRNHLLTPSSDNIANYSSDSRSYQDDCASTSTFLSPTDEPELYFDNWSICSEDNYMLHATPSPTVSRLSRASQLSSPTRGGDGSDPNESVIDRIKRRSFYCRFNEKKPRRTSSIVGPSAVRDYYREQQNSCKARSSNKLNTATANASVSLTGNERDASPDITQQFFRPLKLSPVGTELKPPVYKASFDNQTSSATGSKPRKSLNDIRPTISPSYLSKRYSSMTGHDYLSTVPTRFKSSSSSSPYDSTCGSGAVGSTTYYSTYNPKRRSSYTLNGGLASGSNISNSNIDGFATVGRRSARAYDHRTMSLLDPPTTSSYCRDARTPVRDYTSNVSRSNSRYRTSSTSRSPTNI